LLCIGLLKTLINKGAELELRALGEPASVL
jgi:hypothetical protein